MFNTQAGVTLPAVQLLILGDPEDHGKVGGMVRSNWSLSERHYLCR